MPANYADIIFFAIVAVYLGLKLFSVLGKKNEQDAKIETASVNMSFAKPKEKEVPTIITTPIVIKNNLEDFKFSNSGVKSAISEIIEKDPQFSLESFAEGSKIALEMLHKAYSEGDRKTLQNLVSDEVYKMIDKEMEDKAAKNLIGLRSLVAIDDMEFSSASLEASRAKIAVKFTTEQINVVKDSNGNIVEGDPKIIEKVEDVIEFERNIRSSNPNWTIISL